MSIKDYLKERRYMLLIAFAAAVFCLLVYWASCAPPIIYILQGMLIFFALFVVTDFLILRSRLRKMRQYIDGGATKEISFAYPTDDIYAAYVRQIAKDFNVYRARMEADYMDELDFITKWVHDIKVPISALYLLIDNLEAENAEKLEMQTAFIAQHTQKVLYHIKAKSFHDDFKISKVRTNAIIKAALKPYAAFFSSKKISLALLDDDYTVLTDEKWSGYIISQLLSNAVKHTPRLGCITIKTTMQHGKTVISVRNTGMGIHPSHLSRIFKKGYSAHPTRNGSTSTGYGLYLAKKLSDRMGHDLYAFSKQGEYAEVCLAFADVTKM